MPEQTPTSQQDEKVHDWYVFSDGFNMATYMNKRIYGQLAYFNDKSSAAKNKYFKCQWIFIICTSLTPILVSVSESSILGTDTGISHQIIYVATLSTSLIAGIITAIQKAFKYQEIWTTTRTVCEMINREKFLYEACVGEYADKKRRDALFVERIEGLLAHEQNQWLGSTTNASKGNVKDEDGDGDIDANDIKLAKKTKSAELSEDKEQ